MDRGTEDIPMATHAPLDLRPAPEVPPAPLVFVDARLRAETEAWHPAPPVGLFYEGDGTTERRQFAPGEAALTIEQRPIGEPCHIRIRAPGYAHHGWYEQLTWERHTDGRPDVLTARDDRSRTTLILTYDAHGVTLELRHEMIAPPRDELRALRPFQERERWLCPIGSIDDCAAHGWGDGVPGSVYARMVRARELVDAPRVSPFVRMNIED